MHNMDKIFKLLCASFCVLSARTNAECELGWLAYKNELCIKVFPNLVNFEDASSFCSSQGNSLSTASLVMVKGPEIQEVLANYTNGIYDNVWLGAKYDVQAHEFRWVDGEPLSYTNWQDGYPRNLTDPNTCIELKPANAKLDINTKGKWADAKCQKHNLIACQKTLSWTLQDAVGEILKIRKQLDEATSERDELRDQLQASTSKLREDIQSNRNEIQSVATKVVPVGSIYIEYYNQPSPRSLWPNSTWQDISSSYAGLFFRAFGGNSAGWGDTQTECAPRINQFQFADTAAGSPPPYLQNIPASGWSNYGFVGRSYGHQNVVLDEILKFHTLSCEVRPKNQATRIWKRIG